MTRARQAAAELLPKKPAAPATPAAAPVRDTSPPRTGKTQKTRSYLMQSLVVVGFLSAYCTPLALFFSEGNDMTAVSGDSSDVALALRISVVDLAREQLTFQITPSGGPIVGNNGRLLKDVTVETDPGTDSCHIRSKPTCR